jgi:hypothetical protein
MKMKALAPAEATPLYIVDDHFRPLSAQRAGAATQILQRLQASDQLPEPRETQSDPRQAMISSLSAPSNRRCEYAACGKAWGENRKGKGEGRRGK